LKCESTRKSRNWFFPVMIINMIYLQRNTNPPQILLPLARVSWMFFKNYVVMLSRISFSEGWKFCFASNQKKAKGRSLNFYQKRLHEGWKIVSKQKREKTKGKICWHNVKNNFTGVKVQHRGKIIKWERIFNYIRKLIKTLFVTRAALTVNRQKFFYAINRD
jgi:hypothetical protein